MNSKKFVGLSGNIHEPWAASVLNMNRNYNGGVDLYDDLKEIEIKFELGKKDSPARNWTPQNYQLKYSNGKPIFWGLGIYRMNCEIFQLPNDIDLNSLQKYITSRILYIVKWDWMDQFSPSHCKGKKGGREWDNTFRYPKLSKMPRTIQSFEVCKGLIHLTEGVDPTLFDVNGKRLEIILS